MTPGIAGIVREHLTRKFHAATYFNKCTHSYKLPRESRGSDGGYCVYRVGVHVGPTQAHPWERESHFHSRRCTEQFRTVAVTCWTGNNGFRFCWVIPAAFATTAGPPPETGNSKYHPVRGHHRVKRSSTYFAALRTVQRNNRPGACRNLRVRRNQALGSFNTASEQ